MPDKKGFVGIAAIIIIALIVLGGGYYFAQKTGFFYDNGKSDIVEPVQQNQTADQTTNWQTYTSKSFSIQYPIGWVVSELKEGPEYERVNFRASKDQISGLGVTIYKKSFRTADTEINRYISVFDKNLTKSNITLDGIIATKLDISVIDGGGNTTTGSHIIFSVTDQTYDISYGGLGITPSQFSYFFNSFKLIK